ncbi:hypothetical protein COBT_002041, partial [Conglomerata obtusa]
MAFIFILLIFCKNAVYEPYNIIETITEINTIVDNLERLKNPDLRYVEFFASGVINFTPIVFTDEMLQYKSDVHKISILRVCPKKMKILGTNKSDNDTNHHNIIKIHLSFEQIHNEQTIYWYVMEYFNFFDTHNDIIKKYQIKKLCIDICNGLDYLHNTKNVVHNNINRHTIVYTRKNYAYTNNFIDNIINRNCSMLMDSNEILELKKFKNIKKNTKDIPSDSYSLNPLCHFSNINQISYVLRIEVFEDHKNKCWVLGISVNLDANIWVYDYSNLENFLVISVVEYEKTILRLLNYSEFTENCGSSIILYDTTVNYNEVLLVDTIIDNKIFTIGSLDQVLKDAELVFKIKYLSFAFDEGEFFEYYFYGEIGFIAPIIKNYGLSNTFRADIWCLGILAYMLAYKTFCDMFFDLKDNKKILDFILNDFKSHKHE